MDSIGKDDGSGEKRSDEETESIDQGGLGLSVVPGVSGTAL